MNSIKYSLELVIIAVGLLASACSNLDSSLPDPIKLVNDSGRTDIASDSCDILEPKNLDAFYMCKIANIEISKDAEKIVSKAEARDAVIDGLIFLSENFGSPPLQQQSTKINIKVNLENKQGHAFFEKKKNGRKDIEINVINLSGSQKDYLVHELFHAYYQNDKFFSKKLEEIEAWATYAQLRYKYRGLNNGEIKNKIIEIYDIKYNDIDNFKKINIVNVPDQFKAKAYIIYSLELLSKKHFLNYLSYRQII
ncbi:MAG: hypothetical protein V9H25_08210 [Candidatus Competibacter sp.]